MHTETTGNSASEPTSASDMQSVQPETHAEKSTESLPALPRKVLRPPDHLHSNKEIAEWFLAQGRRVVMPRREGSGCEEITLDYEWT